MLEVQVEKLEAVSCEDVSMTATIDPSLVSASEHRSIEDLRRSSIASLIQFDRAMESLIKTLHDINRMLAPILLFSILVLGGVDAVAQKSTSGDASRNDDLAGTLLAPMTEQLKLTREQQSQIETIARAEYLRSEALLFRLNQTTAELDEEQLKETFDEDKVRALAAQAGQIMAEIIVVKLRVKSKVMALLTPDQRAIIEQHLRVNKQISDGLSIY